jgi:ribonuclease HI
MSQSPTTYYVVVRGHRPGIYTRRFGPNGFAAQLVGHPNTLWKRVASLDEARAWLEEVGATALLDHVAPAEAAPTAESALSAVTIYTDGGAEPNPGRAGWAAVLLFGEHQRELSGGYALSTNNRMEILAAIHALEALKRPCRVTLYSDSRYLVDAMTLGWAKRWQEQGWMRNRKDRAQNPDLWERLLALCAEHMVSFEWTRGHAGQAENERCDQLAGEALRRDDLPPDPGYRTESPLPLFDL